MSLRSRVLPVLVAAAGLAGCVTTGSNQGGARDPLTLVGTDRAKAATQLAEYLRQRGFDAKLNSDTAVLVKGDVNLLLLPILMDSGLDRIMVEAIYSFTDDAKAQNLAAPQILRLNHDFDFAQFSIDDDGDLFILTAVTFVDQIEFIELMHGINLFKALTLEAVGTVDDGLLE